jgi:hypothetical protein
MTNYQIYDRDLKCLFEGQYDKIDLLLNSTKKLLIKVSIDDVEMLLDETGKVVVDDQYSMISKLEKGESMSYFIVNKKNKFGYIKEDGTKITECIFDEFAIYHDKRFKNGFALVVEKGIKKFIKEDGSLFQVVDTSVAYGFDNGLALLKKGGFYGFLDTSGKPVSDFVYSNAYRFTENQYGYVAMNGKWGVIDKNNNIVIDFIYDEIGSFDDIKYDKNIKSLKVKSGKLFGILNPDKKIKTDKYYKEIQYCGSDLFVVKGEKKWGLVNLYDEEILSFEYDQINVLNHFALLKKGSKYSIVNLNEKNNILCKGDSSCFFTKYFSIKNKTQLYVLNTEEKKIYNSNLSFEFDKVVSIKNNFLVCQLNDKNGVIDLNGNLIIAFNFTKITIDVDDNNKTYFITELDNFKAPYDENGNQLFELKHKFISLRSNYFIVGDGKAFKFHQLDGSNRLESDFDKVQWQFLNGHSYFVTSTSGSLGSKIGFMVVRESKTSNECKLIVVSQIVKDHTFVLAFGYSGGGTWGEVAAKIKTDDNWRTSTGLFTNYIHGDFWQFTYNNDNCNEIEDKISDEDKIIMHELEAVLLKKYIYFDDSKNINQDVPLLAKDFKESLKSKTSDYNISFYPYHNLSKHWGLNYIVNGFK